MTDAGPRPPDGGNHGAGMPNIDRYRPLVDRFDLTDEEKVELIHTVWRIVEGFAYRAFGLDPVQQTGGRANTGDAPGEAPMLDLRTTADPPTPLKTTFGRETHERGTGKT